MIVNSLKIKNGEYLLNHHKYVFLALNSNEGHWSLYNQSNVEIYRDDNKKALINMLESYDLPGTINLHNQEWSSK